MTISYYLVLSGILFACGVTGFLIKRNIISIFMSIELMLNGVNLSFVAFAADPRLLISSKRNSPAVWYLICGIFASERMMACSTGSGIFGAMLLGGGGAVSTCERISSYSLVLLNGTRPVSIS